MKKILAALILMLGLNSMADDISLWQKSTLNQVVQKGVLRVGLEPGYMPFEMKDKKGNIIGFDVDMAKAVAKAMGVKLEFVPTAWDGIIAGLLTGKYDIIMSGMTVTQERNLKVNFANPYISVGQTIIAAKKHAGKTWKELDNAKYTVVTKLGVTGEIATRKMFKKAKIRTFETEADAAQEVMNGNADAFVYDKPYNAIFYAQKKATGQIIHLDEDLTYEPLGWAVRKGDPDFINWLNNFLNQAKHDGTYAKIYSKWFERDAWQKKVM
ncbi:transporter substrate-binding domain-containing protein [Sulfurospirillum arcachonense]|uniref:transporter substrate-binding domain-containing protein n=1 Tax=Sulfurospirillum arcachonense TaxID=57666 RepID=UPI0004689E4F|nr:transporter substrate-binding domain-containing protein [Sulfurospirillum arcachonense]